MYIEIYAAQPGSVEVYAFHARTETSCVFEYMPPGFAVDEAWDGSISYNHSRRGTYC
jgi:hypothetical protein